MVDKDFFHNHSGNYVRHEGESLEEIETSLKRDMYDYGGPGQSYTRGTVNIKDMGDKYKFNISKEFGYDI